jgi:hypothetical protein
MTTAGLWTIILTACVGVIGYLYKVWSERVRSRKLVLFYLLEIQYVLKTLPIKTDDLANRYVQYCEGIYETTGLPVTEKTAESIQSFTPSIQNYFDELGAAFKTSLDDQFKKAYDDSLQNLAKDNPILAYKLQGRLCLEKMAMAVNSYSAVLKSLPEVVENEVLGNVLKEFIDDSIKKTFAEILDEINKDITKLAWGCGPLAIWNCSKIIKKKIELNDDFSEFGLEEEFESYMSKIIEEAQKRLSSDTPKSPLKA